MAKLRKRAWMKLSEAAEMLSNLTGETVTFNDLLRYGEEGTLTLSFYFLEPLPVHIGNYKTFNEPEIGVSPWERLRHYPDHTLYKGGANDEFPHQISGLWEIQSTDTSKILFVHGAETRDETEILTRALPRITKYAENGPYWRYLYLFSIGMDRVQTAAIHHQDIPANTLVCVRPEMIEQIMDETGEPIESNTEVSELHRTQRTLAAIATGLASKYPAYRKNGGKPNASQLAKLATEHLRDAASDRTPHGFSETTARLTIAEALKACPDLTET